MRLLRPYNPLAYPGGARPPGFDPNHVAISPGSYCRLSYVATMNGGFNLLARTLPTFGASAFILDGKIGPTVKGGSGVLFTNCPCPPTANNDYPFTLACIGVATASGSRAYINTSGNVQSKGCYLIMSGSANWALGTYEGSGQIDTGLSTGNSSGLIFPFFVAVSFDGATINTVYLRLDNFELTSNSKAATIASLHSQGGTHGLFQGDEGTQQVAAATVINNSNSLSTLLQWAADPWAFWYPPAMQQIMFSGLRGQISGGSPALFSRALLGVGL